MLNLHQLGLLAATSVAAVVVGWVVTAAYRRARISWALRKLPVAPGSVPFFGHALLLAANTPWDLMFDWSKANGFGLVVLNFLMQKGIVVSDPELLRRVMDRNHRNYPKDIELSYKPFLDILGKSVIVVEGERWRKQRNRVSAAFRIDILQETVGVAKRAVDRLSAKLDKHVASGEPVEIAEEFRVLTLQVIGELILGLSAEESERIFPQLYLPIVNEANRRVWAPYRPYLPTREQREYRKTVGELNGFISGMITERWERHRALESKHGQVEIAEPDILDRVLLSVAPEEWGRETVLGLTDEFKSFILAGHETSASMLTWSIYELYRNPECLAAVLDEGRKVFGACRGAAGGGRDEYQNSPLPSAKELSQLTYTVNALKESLRLYSLVPVVTRVTKEDDVLGDQPVPAGTKIFVNIKAVHSNPANWEKPEKYDPTRFDRDYHPYAFLPFINGPRNCLGQHLALLEGRIVLSLLSQRFKFTPANDHVGDLHPYMVPVCPKDGMHLKVERR